MVLIAATAAVFTAVSVSVVALSMFFRRVAPRLTNEELKRIPGFEKDGPFASFEVVPKLAPVERDELKHSFLRGSDFRWLVVGGDGTNKDLNKKGTELQKRHWEVTSYLIECILRFAEMYGNVLVCRDAEDGRYLGSVCIVPPYASRRVYSAHFMRSVVPMGMPVSDRMEGGVKERFHAFAEEIEKAHDDVMKNTPHWYVANVGVAESAQGRGIGRKLLEAASAIADNNCGGPSSSSVPPPPMYLECHDGNAGFYQKMGYKRERQYDLKPVMKSEKTDDDDTPYPYNAMVRHSAAQ